MSTKTALFTWVSNKILAYLSFNNDINLILSFTHFELLYHSHNVISMRANCNPSWLYLEQMRKTHAPLCQRNFGIKQTILFPLEYWIFKTELVALIVEG
jgi:hypothetical protein